MSPPIEHVATVAGRPIPLAWVDQRLAELRRGRLGRHLPPGEGEETLRLRRWIVQELVTRAVLRHEAERAGLLPTTSHARAYRRIDADARAGAGAPALPADVAQDLFDLVTRRVVVLEPTMSAYYERNVDRYRRPEARLIRYVISDTRGRSRAVLESLLRGTASVSPCAVRQGEMWLHRGELVGPLEDAVYDAVIDDVVGPFELDRGWMMARLIAIAPATCLSFEEARAGIAAELLRASKARAFDEWVASRRAALATIELAYEHPGHPLHGLPRHRH